MLHSNYILNMKKLITPYPYYSEGGVIGYYQVESCMQKNVTHVSIRNDRDIVINSPCTCSCVRNESMESGSLGLVLDVREVRTTVNRLYIHRAWLQYEGTQS
jgi:hypothetical protein